MTISFQRHVFILVISESIRACFIVSPRIENGNLRYDYQIEANETAHIAMEADGMAILRVMMGHIERTLVRACGLPLHFYDNDKSE